MAFTFQDKVLTAIDHWGSIKATAEHYGVSPSTISNWKSGGGATSQNETKINRSFGQLARDENQNVLIQQRVSPTDGEKQTRRILPVGNGETKREQVKKLLDSGQGVRLTQKVPVSPEYPRGFKSLGWSFDLDIDELDDEIAGDWDSIVGIIDVEEGE